MIGVGIAAIISVMGWTTVEILASRDFRTAGGRYTASDGMMLANRVSLLERAFADSPAKWLTDEVARQRQEDERLQVQVDTLEAWMRAANPHIPKPAAKPYSYVPNDKEPPT